MNKRPVGGLLGALNARLISKCQLLFLWVAVTINAQQRSEYSLWGWVNHFIHKTLKDIEKKRKPHLLAPRISARHCAWGLTCVSLWIFMTTLQDTELYSWLFPLTSDEVFSNTDSNYKRFLFFSHSKCCLISCKPATVSELRTQLRTQIRGFIKHNPNRLNSPRYLKMRTGRNCPPQMHTARWSALLSRHLTS